MVEGGAHIRIGIVACEVLKREIESLTNDDADVVHREYLEFALHVYPKEMRSTIIDKVNSLEGKVDAVFLGYGICQSLSGIEQEVRVPIVILEFDDCIAALLGPSEYAREKQKCAGTWFASPGWAEKGLEGVVQALHLDALKDDGHPSMKFVKIVFKGYSRALFIDPGIEGSERFERMSRDFADQVGLQHGSRKCSLRAISEAMERTKALATARAD